MIFVQYPNRDTLMAELADIIVGQLAVAIDKDGSASLAVPGGTTPGPIFDVLCEAKLDWARVSVMLTDERWVPETSDRSNTRLLRERLLIKEAEPATYVPLYADAERPEQKLPDLDAGLAAHLPLTVALLGMGADMHTASIFPGADKLSEALSGDDNLVAMRAPGALEPRITLSAKALNTAAHKHILIVGPEKKSAYEQALNLTPDLAPVAAILSGTSVHWAEG